MASQKPVSPIVIGIVNLVLGCLGICGVLMQLVMWLGLIPMPEEAQMQDPTAQLMVDNQAFAWFTYVNTGLSTVVMVVSIVAAVGLLLYHAWARVVTIGYGFYSIVITVLTVVVHGTLIYGPLLTQYSDGPQRMGLLIGMGIGLGFAGISLVYMCVMIWFLTRPRVIAAFAENMDVMTDDKGVPTS